MSVLSATGNLGDVICPSPQADGAYIDTGTGELRSLPELAAMAASLAGGLSERFPRGSRIAIIGENGLQFTLSYLALMRAGLVAVPVSYRLPPETIAFILQDSECQASIGDVRFQHLIPPECSFIAFDSNLFSDLLEHAAINSVVPDAAEHCEILYTSGSTGRPKGVPLDHAGQLWALEKFVSATGRDPQSSVIAAPAYHMNGLFFYHGRTCLGMADVFDAAF